MKGRRGTGLLAILAAAAVALSCSGRWGEEPPQFQNLVLVMIDTLRPDHLSCYGYERSTSPFLDGLAAEGIQLDGYASSSWTKASIATLLTGLHPQRHQALSRTDGLPENLPTLPRLLQEKGYSTAAYVGNRNVGRKFGFSRGYNTFQQSRPTGKVDAVRVTNRSLRLAAKLQAPFFLSVHYVDPHDPYQPAKVWGDDDGASRSELLQPRRLRQKGVPASEADLQRLVDQYDGEILEMDGEIRRLFEGLEAKGLLENTLVVVTADHGEEFGEHGGLTHGRTLFEEVLRVPLIFWASENLPTHNTRHRFHQVDFLPTVLQGLGLDIPSLNEAPGIDGISRWSEILAEDPVDPRPAFFHIDLDGHGALAVRDENRKLIHRWQEPHDLLFDLAADPAERSPLEENLELRRELLRHHNRLGILAAERRKESLDDETRRSLAALGYLQLDTPEEELEERVVPRKLDRELGLAGLEPPQR